MAPCPVFGHNLEIKSDIGLLIEIIIRIKHFP
jgi:hypothetical protein